MKQVNDVKSGGGGGELIIDCTGQRKIHNNRHNSTFPLIILQKGDFKCKEEGFYDISSRWIILLLNV